jgi:hypothetical protein
MALAQERTPTYSKLFAEIIHTDVGYGVIPHPLLRPYLLLT